MSTQSGLQALPRSRRASSTTGDDKGPLELLQLELEAIPADLPELPTRQAPLDVRELQIPILRQDAKSHQADSSVSTTREPMGAHFNSAIALQTGPAVGPEWGSEAGDLPGNQGRRINLGGSKQQTHATNVRQQAGSNILSSGENGISDLQMMPREPAFSGSTNEGSIVAGDCESWVGNSVEPADSRHSTTNSANATTAASNENSAGIQQALNQLPVASSAQLDVEPHAEPSYNEDSFASEPIDDEYDILSEQQPCTHNNIITALAVNTQGSIPYTTPAKPLTATHRELETPLSATPPVRHGAAVQQYSKPAAAQVKEPASCLADTISKELKVAAPRHVQQQQQQQYQRQPSLQRSSLHQQVSDVLQHAAPASDVEGSDAADNIEQLRTDSITDMIRCLLQDPQQHAHGDKVTGMDIAGHHTLQESEPQPDPATSFSQLPQPAGIGQLLEIPGKHQSHGSEDAFERPTSSAHHHVTASQRNDIQVQARTIMPGRDFDNPNADTCEHAGTASNSGQQQRTVAVRSDMADVLQEKLCDSAASVKERCKDNVHSSDVTAAAGPTSGVVALPEAGQARVSQPQMHVVATVARTGHGPLVQHVDVQPAVQPVVAARNPQPVGSRSFPAFAQVDIPTSINQMPMNIALATNQTLSQDAAHSKQQAASNHNSKSLLVKRLSWDLSSKTFACSNPASSSVLASNSPSGSPRIQPRQLHFDAEDCNSSAAPSHVSDDTLRGHIINLLQSMQPSTRVGASYSRSGDSTGSADDDSGSPSTPDALKLKALAYLLQCGVGIPQQTQDTCTGKTAESVSSLPGSPAVRTVATEPPSTPDEARLRDSDMSGSAGLSQTLQAVLDDSHVGGKVLQEDSGPMQELLRQLQLLSPNAAAYKPQSLSDTPGLPPGTASQATNQTSLKLDDQTRVQNGPVAKPVTVVGCPSRLSNATTSAEPIPEPLLTATNTATTSKAAAVPVSAAATTPARNKHHSDLASVLSNHSHATSAPGSSVCSPIGSPARKRREDVDNLIERLKQSGHVVSPQAAMVLSYVLDSTDGAPLAEDGAVARAIAAELRADSQIDELNRQANSSAHATPGHRTQDLVSRTIAGTDSQSSSVGGFSIDAHQGSLMSDAHTSVSSQTGITAQSGRHVALTNVLRALNSAPTESKPEQDSIPVSTFNATTIPEKAPTDFVYNHQLSKSGSLSFKRLDPVPEKRSVTIPVDEPPAWAATEPVVMVQQPDPAPSQAVLQNDTGKGSLRKRGSSKQTVKEQGPAAATTQAVSRSSSKKEKQELHMEQQEVLLEDVNATPDTATAVASKRIDGKEGPVQTQGVSLMHAWRATSQQQSAGQKALQRASRPAPSSPRRAQQVKVDALRSTSPLLPDQRANASLGDKSEKSASRACSKVVGNQSGEVRSAALFPARSLSAGGAANVNANVTSKVVSRACSVERQRGASVGGAKPKPASNTPLDTTGIVSRPGALASRSPVSNSILDKLTSPPNKHMSPTVVTSISKPFAWQERVTRAWLLGLLLEVSASEENADLLDNPFRNGLLFCDLAGLLTSVPVRNAVCNPKTMSDARANLLLALDHMGMLGSELNDDQLALLQEACNGDGDRWQRRRSYSAKLVERKTAVGGALLLEVERILQGKKEAVWGVLNFIREQSSGQSAFQGPASDINIAEEAAQRAAAAMEARTEAYEQAMAAAARIRNSGPTFREQQQQQATTVLVQTRTPPSPSKHSAGKHPRFTANQPPALQQPFVRGGPAEDYGLTGVIPSGVGPLTMAVGPCNLSPCRKLQLLELEKAELQRRRALQQSLASVEAQLLQQQEGACNQEDTTVSNVMQQYMSSPNRHSSNGSACVGQGRGLGIKSSWPQPKPPYSSEQKSALESSVVRWMLEMGVITPELAAQGYSELHKQLYDGVFLAWLVQNITGQHITGINKKPLVDTHRRGNISKAIQVLRPHPNMSRRSLNYEEALLYGEPLAMLLLLEDLHRMADGQPPAGTVYLPHHTPYLPFAAASSVSYQSVPVHSASPPTISSDRLSSKPSSAPRSPRAGNNDNDVAGAPWYPPGVASMLVTPGKAAYHRGTHAPRRSVSPERSDTTPSTLSMSATSNYYGHGVATVQVAPSEAEKAAHWRERRSAAAVAGAPKLHNSAVHQDQAASFLAEVLQSAALELDDYMHGHQQDHRGLDLHPLQGVPMLRISQRKSMK